MAERALEKRPARREPRTLRLARYLQPKSYPALPPGRDWIDRSRRARRPVQYRPFNTGNGDIELHDLGVAAIAYAEALGYVKAG